MANSVKFIQITKQSEEEYRSALSSVLESNPGAIIFGQYTKNNKQVQELYANGTQYNLGGVDIEGVSGNLVAINSTGDGLIDGNIAVNDIITQIKSINGTVMEGEGNVKAGVTFSNITPVNKSEIDTLDTLREIILSHNQPHDDSDSDSDEEYIEQVPEGYTFDQFIKDLFRKVNAERTETDEKSPTVTLSSTRTTDLSYTLEVGDTSTKTMSQTISKDTYTDGQLLTHIVTMGESTDSTSYINAGCSTTNKNYQILNSSNTVVATNQAFSTSVSGNFTYSDGELSKPTKIEKTIGAYKVKQFYGDSTNWENCVSSYGNALYDENPMTESSVTSSSSPSIKLTINADFYRFWGASASAFSEEGHKSLGAKSQWQQVLTNNFVFLYPAGKAVTIRWTTTSTDDSQPSSQDYNIKTVYLKLPSGGNPEYTETVPQTGKYATYNLYTLTTAPVGKTCKISIS